MNLKSKILFKFNYFTNYLKYVLLANIGDVTKTNPVINSFETTLNQVINNRVSLTRFGDGEIRLLNEEGIEFQQCDKVLTGRLKEILKNNYSGILVAVPDVFSRLHEYTSSTKYFWRHHLDKYRKTWLKNIDPKKQYYNAFITRPYMAYTDKTNTGLLFKKIRKIWAKKDIVIIEGDKSRIGVANDLLSEANSVRRIICPAKNAFSVYEEILAEIKAIPKSVLVLIALGPTATVLAFDLHQLGYQAIDIGHIDIEYEWFLMNAVAKIKIPTKYTNEAAGGDMPEDLYDPNYEAQIIQRIL